MQKNSLAALMFALGMGAFSPVHADGSASEIARISEEIAVLQAKQRRLDVELMIAQKQGELNKLSGASQPASMANTMPTVRSIEGIDGKLRATFAFGSGMTQTKSQGDVLANGWKVERIDVSTVTLSNGKDRRSIAFGNEPPAQLTQPGSSMPQMLPGMR